MVVEGVETIFDSNTAIARCIQLIENSRRSLLISAYAFSNKEITNALMGKASDMIYIGIIVDAFALTYDDISNCIEFGYECYLDTRHSIFHNKYIVIDKRIVFTGSMNFSENARRNAENSIVLSGSIAVAPYVDSWKNHRDHSKKLTIENLEYEKRLARTFMSKRLNNTLV